MYRIYSDDFLIYDPQLDDYAIISGSLNQELNTSGSLSFQITKNHPNYGRVNLMKSIVTMYDGDRLVFRGRPYAPSIDLFENDNIDCEGELAFFNDTYYPPFEYTGNVSGLFTQVIEYHNSQVDADKQFIVGNISVTSDTEEGNIVRASEKYMNTWELLRDKFFGSKLGGYLWIRHEQDGNYIDYVNDLNYLGRQSVEQTINLMDAKKEISADGLATVIIPLGKTKDAEGKDTILTIESVNGGKNYIEDENGIATYGRIVKVVEHDDITIASNLLRAGRSDLSSALGVTTSVTLSAADLSRAGFSVDPFMYGTYVDVAIKNLNIKEKMLIKGLKIDLLSPERNSISLGSERRSLTAESLQTARTIGNLREQVARAVRDQQQMAVELRRETSSSIEQASDSITTMVAENYYNTAQADELYAALSTMIQQRADEILFQFNEFKTLQEEVDDETQEIFEEWRRYIRFVNGAIELGIVGNPLILRLQNDIIEYLENGSATSYWQNNTFYSTDGEFLNSLQLGNFAFVPRESGNLSFYKNR